MERRRRLTRRALPAAVAVAVALGALALVFTRGDSAAERAVTGFAAAWEQSDYTAMYSLISAEAQAGISRADFERAYRDAAATATAIAIAVGEVDSGDGAVTMPVTVTTRVFGTVEGPIAVQVTDDDAIAWERHLVFPGLAPGLTLRRETEAPERAAILAADGQVLAEGPAGARSSPIPEIASSIAGALEPPADDAERGALYARGFPDDTPVGASGLEKVFEARVAGRPGGELLAGDEVLARREPRPAKAVRSTIDVGVQEAASVALAGRLGGVAALNTRTGEILGLAGIAFSAPQPPGSTFKIVTTTAALEADQVRPASEFPVQSAAIVDGVEFENAGRELCGGDFVNSFAHSCNSVFGPLGVEVGARRLVAVAERYGWNEDPGIPGAMTSEIPQADEIVTPLEVASTAIGQFRTLSTTLQMASVAQTVANRGVRLAPTLSPTRGRPAGERVTSPRVARVLTRLMVAVVDYGTGTLAHVEGVEVAGKTGTAELGDTRGDDPEAQAREGDPSNTDAWFTSFAPADAPRVAVAVMLVRNGAGGATAAPAAQGVLVAGLER